MPDNELPVDPSAEPFVQFDKEDDRQILSEIQGSHTEILQKMVYSYQDRRGGVITGLSLTGVRETVREMNRRGLARIRITEAPPIVEETDEHFRVMVYATDELNGGGAWGSKVQSKRSGNYANPFAFEQALSKAQRNALHALIPAGYVTEMIRSFLEQNEPHRIGPHVAIQAPARAAIPAQATPARPVQIEAPQQPPRTGVQMPQEEVTKFSNWREKENLSPADILTMLGAPTLRKYLEEHPEVTTADQLRKVIQDQMDAPKIAQLHQPGASDRPRVLPD